MNPGSTAGEILFNQSKICRTLFIHLWTFSKQRGENSPIGRALLIPASFLNRGEFRLRNSPIRQAKPDVRSQMFETQRFSNSDFSEIFTLMEFLRMQKLPN